MSEDFSRGQMAERERIRAIVDAPEAAADPLEAVRIATETGVSAAQARRLLGSGVPAPARARTPTTATSTQSEAAERAELAAMIAAGAHTPRGDD